MQLFYSLINQCAGSYCGISEGGHNVHQLHSNLQEVGGVLWSDSTSTEKEAS